MRLACLTILVACSSSSKQPEDSVAAKPTIAAAPDAASSTASGSGGDDPWSKEKPRDPAAEKAELRADVDIICGAAKVTGGKVWMDVGPYIAEHMKTGHKMMLFKDVRTTSLDEVIERIRSLMAKADVQTCETLDVLIANDPRKKR